MTEPCAQNEDFMNFLKLDYERVLQLIADLHKHKIDYQKFYIGIVTVIGTVSITLVNFYSTTGIVLKGTNFKIENLIGLLLLISTTIGYAIIHNLVSIRKSEVFFNNSLIQLREQLIFELKLGKNYPQLEKAVALDRRSADYVTILVSSFVNMLFFIFGICLIFSNLESFGMVFITSISSIIYFLIHLITIEGTLKKGLKQN